MATAEQVSQFPDLSGKPPIEIIRWAWETYGERLMTTTAFGYSGMAMLHMLSKVAPDVPIYFINTGYHFSQTIEFRDFCRDRLGMNIIDLTPETPREKFESIHGDDLMRRDPDKCCAHNKVAPMTRLLAERRYDGWLAALRRDQAKTREGVRIIEPRTASGIVKVHPLAEWTKAQVWHYINQNKVPTHPLHEEGFMSIGCAPCTRPVGLGEDERDGRWAGKTKTECGIHLEGMGGDGI